MNLRMLLGIAFAAAGLMLSAAADQAVAAPDSITITRLPGLPHLPMILMQEEKLVDKHLKAEGLSSVQVQWAVMNGATQVDALISGRADFTDFGLTNLATAWAATNGQIRALAGVSSVPSFLITNNPNLKSLQDLQPNDRIAVPSIQVSPQAIWLKMAAKKEFGDSKRLDRYTVAMAAPDATVAIMSTSGGITAHFSVPPYQEQALKQAGVHKVLSSTDVMGVTSTQVVISTTTQFHDQNPKIVKAVLDATNEAMSLIKNEPEKVAEIYLRSANDNRTSKSELVEMLKDKDFVYDTQPIEVGSFIDFMYEIGQLKRKPSSWKNLFFSDVLKQ